MPLTEFLGMSKGKVDVSQQGTSTSTDPSCRPDTDCVELVWENGQIMMQGQSSKVRKGPISSNFQTVVPKSQDIRNTNGLKTAKFGTMDSVLADFQLPVPSCEMGLDQADDMVPWLNYSMEDPLHNDYTSDFLHELSGVTINDFSMENRRSSFQGEGHSSVVNDSVSLKHGSTSKSPLVAEKNTRVGSSEISQLSLPFQHNVPRSGISSVTGNNTGNAHQLTSRDSIHNQSSLSDFTSLRLQKLDAGQPSTSSGFTNFSYFSRHAAAARANHQTVNGSNKLETQNNSQNQSAVAPANGNSQLLPGKSTEELFSSNQPRSQEKSARMDISQNQALGGAVTTAGIAGQRNMEPVVATSSVCSGNSVDRASNEPSHDLKRKSREAGDSEGPSEEVEEESVGARKAASARTGSKRSRAAEVHNLSERRRRDRINEKMRALQELIPNCNKVDKASMLDEAIEYLKTLQLQVQILSMGAGLYMQPMMLPPGIQPIHGAHMPHFSPMGVGMGMGIGYGMNMLDMSGGMKMMPFQGPHYPVPAPGPNFHGMPGSSLQPFGHPGQGSPISMQRAPILPVSNVPPLKVPIGPNLSGVAGSTNLGHLAPSSSSKDVGPQQAMPTSNNFNSSMSQASDQATNKAIEHPTMPHNQVQAVNASEAPVAASGTETMPS